MGTIWNDADDLFRLIIDAVQDRANVIVTVGRQNDPEALGPQPPHVVVRRFIPQEEILQRCDVVVAHGGSGTVLGALTAGVPLLVLPQGADQWNNADRVVRAGAGRRLLAEEVSVDAVRHAVTDLLDDRSYRGRSGADPGRDRCHAGPGRRHRPPRDAPLKAAAAPAPKRRFRRAGCSPTRPRR